MCVWTITDLWRSKWGNVRLTGNFLQYLFWVIQTHQLTGGENRRKELQSNHTTNGGAGKKGNRAAIRISCSSLRSWRFRIVGRGFATIQYLV